LLGNGSFLLPTAVGRSSARPSCRGFFARAFTTQSDLLSHGTTRFRVASSDHRVVRFQLVALAILFGRQSMRAEVMAERLVRLPVDQRFYVILRG